jgi:histidine ammonia-lyase
MIAHCTAAALTSENKVLCHPSSSDTITTSGGTEDHVSMGGWSARKALKVINNVENILAIELLAACQALEFFHANGYTTTEPLEAVFNVVRKFIEPWKKDR